MVKRLAFLALTAAVFSGAAAQAGTTVVNAVLDRPYVFPDPSDRHPTYYTQYLTPSFAFNPGDTLDVTLTFPGGMPLSLGFLPSDVEFTVFSGAGGTSATYQSTATLSFLNPVGAVNPTTGPQIGVFDRNPAVDFTGVSGGRSGPLTFDGVHVVIHLDSALLPGGSPAPADSFSAFQISFTNSAPEPATWAMLLLGFGLTGTMMRRRRRDRAHFTASPTS